MKILITGGAGYVGHELVYQLINDPDVEHIIIYDNLSSRTYNVFLDEKLPKGKVSFVSGELLDSRRLRKIIQGIDVVFHLAAKVSTTFGSSEAHIFEQVNHWGTAELVYAAEDSSVSRFIYLSSSSVYGASDEPIDINTPPNPKTFYGSSKLRGEEHVKRLSRKMDAYILRCGNIFGYSPSLRFDTVVNRFMFEANFIGKIQVEGNGKQHRSFIHINKVVNVLHNLMKTPDFPSGVYNLVGKNMSINDIADVVKSIYPQLDIIYVNQHLNMRSLSMQHDTRLQPLITLAPQSIEEDLQQFKNRFSFSSFE